MIAKRVRDVRPIRVPWDGANHEYVTSACM